MSDDRADLERLRKMKRLRELEAKASGGEPQSAPAAVPEPGQESSDRNFAALRGLGQGFTFGQGPNINGLVAALWEKAQGAGGKGTFAESFQRNKGTFERENNAAWDAHPWVYGGGYGAATLPSLFAGAAARGAGATAKAAQLGRTASLADVATLANTGARSGFPLAATLGQLAKQGAWSGLIPGAINGVGGPGGGQNIGGP